MHDMAPAEAAWPLNVPAAQGVHAVGLFVAAYVPMPQPTHADEPAGGSPAKKPLPHGVHAVAPDDAIVPAAQIVHLEPPLNQNPDAAVPTHPRGQVPHGPPAKRFVWPDGHARQSSQLFSGMPGLLAAQALPSEPSAHGAQDPCQGYVCAGHGAHAPLITVKPVAHAVHVVNGRARVRALAAHGVHAVRPMPPAEMVPFAHSACAPVASV